VSNPLNHRCARGRPTRWRDGRHLTPHEAAVIPQQIGEILDAQGLLTEHPMTGREVPGEQGELIIRQDSLIYVALYRYDVVDDEVVVLDLREQREIGFDER